MNDKLGWFLCCSLLFNSMIGFAQDRTLIVKYAERKVDGVNVFRKYCASCHQFEKNLVGPALKGVTQYRSKEWIEKFLRDETEMRTHDSIAKQLASESGFSPCHQFTFKRKDFKALYYYLSICSSGCIDSSKKASTFYEDENGILDSVLTLFHFNGLIAQTILFNHGKYWTSIAAFDTSGKSLNAGTLKNGNGSINFFYGNGNVNTVRELENGHEVTVTNYYENGRIMSELFFSEERLILVRKYDEKGNLTKETSYLKN